MCRERREELERGGDCGPSLHLGVPSAFFSKTQNSLEGWENTGGWAPPAGFLKQGLRMCISGPQGDQSILKEIHPEYSLEGLMLKLKFQYLAT